MNNWKGKYGPLLIAEIGGNHEGDFEYAKRLCELAIESKADYVKFQIYTGDTLVSPVESPDRNNHFKKFELTREQHIELAEMVIAAGRKYTASVWDLSVLDWIDSYMGIYKIGSGDLTAYPIIEAITRRRKPIIISTGLATEKEVVEAVKFIQSCDDIYLKPENLAVLQCTSMYPIEYKDANLNVIHRLRHLTGLPTGYSDHTTDSKAMQYAYAMGAEILEFHFTDTKEGKIFRDHKVSLTKEEVWNLIKELQIISTLKGSETKAPTSIELETNHTVTFRRAAYLRKDVEKGYEIKAEDLVYLRPNHGTDARDFQTLIGRKVNQPTKAFQQIRKENLD